MLSGIPDCRYRSHACVYLVAYCRAAAGTAPARAAGGRAQNGIAPLMAPVSFAQKLQAAAAAQQPGKRSDALSPFGGNPAPAAPALNGAAPQHNTSAAKGSQRRRPPGVGNAEQAAASRTPETRKDATTEYYELSSARGAVKNIEYTLTPARPHQEAVPPPQSGGGTGVEGAKGSGAGSPQPAGRPERPRSAHRTDENRGAEGCASVRAAGQSGQSALAAGRPDGECSPSGDSRQWDGRGVQAAAPLGENRAGSPQAAQPVAWPLPQSVGRAWGSESGQAVTGKRGAAPVSGRAPHQAQLLAAQTRAQDRSREATGAAQAVLRHSPREQPGDEQIVKNGRPPGDLGTPLKRTSSLSTQVLSFRTRALLDLQLNNISNLRTATLHGEVQISHASTDICMCCRFMQMLQCSISSLRPGASQQAVTIERVQRPKDA